jgi:hypothetical protein
MLGADPLPLSVMVHVLPSPQSTVPCMWYSAAFRVKEKADAEDSTVNVKDGYPAPVGRTLAAPTAAAALLFSSPLSCAQA